MKKKAVAKILVYLLLIAVQFGLHMFGVSKNEEATMFIWAMIGTTTTTILIGHFVDWLFRGWKNE